MHTLTLIHRNGDKRDVTARSIRYAGEWGWEDGRRIIIVVWGDLAGEYALDMHDFKLYAFGKGNGLKRKATDWQAADRVQALSVWYQMGGKHNGGAESREGRLRPKVFKM